MALIQRFPAAGDSVFSAGGAGAEHQRAGDIVRAPTRAAIGLRSRASVATCITRARSRWIQF
jgi:hypothetical protein